MTEKAKRNTAPLKAHDAIGKIRAILTDQDERIREAAFQIRTADSKKVAAFAARVTDAIEREDFETMAKALGIDIPVIDAEFHDPGVDGDEPESTDADSEPGESSPIPDRLREPLTPERLAVGRKR